MSGPVRRGWRRANAATRLGLALAAGVVVGVATAVATAGTLAPMIGWDAAAVVYLLGTWLSVGSLDAEQTRAHATREDPSTGLSDLLLLVAAVASLGAVGLVLAGAPHAGGAQPGRIALGIGSVALAWAVVHTLYSLHYARLYYTPPEGGISFGDSTEPPSYADFAYVAFTIGMTYQVSDTAVGVRRIRAAVMRQSLLSFLFGTVIISATVNLVAGLST